MLYKLIKGLLEPEYVGGLFLVLSDSVFILTRLDDSKDGQVELQVKKVIHILYLLR